MAQPPRSKPTPPPDEPTPARPDHHGPKVDHPDDRKRPRWRRRLVRLALFLTLLIIVLAVAMPTLLSTGWGTRLLLAQVNSRIEGHVEVRRLSLAWFSGLSAQGVKYTAADGAHEVTAGRIDLHDTSLWALATGDRALGRVVVKDLHGETIEPRRDGPPTATEPDPMPPASPAPPALPTATPAPDKPGWMQGVSLDLEVDGLSWRYHAPDITPVDLVSSSLVLSMTDEGAARLRVSGALTQGDASGKFDLALDADELLDEQGRLQLAVADLTVDTSMQQAPVDAIARFVAGRTYNNKVLAHLLGTPERVATLLGGRWMAGTLNATGTLSELDAKLRLHAQHLEADLVLTSTGEALRVGEGTTLRMEVTPAGFAAQFPDGRLTLDAPVILTCDRPVVTLPLRDGAVVREQATLRAVVNSGDWSLTDADGRHMTLAQTKLGLAGEALGEELVSALDAVLTIAEPGTARPATDAADAPQPLAARLRTAGLFSGKLVHALRLTHAPTALAEWTYGGTGGLAAAVGPVVQSVVGRVEMDQGRVRGGTLSVNWDAAAGSPAEGALAVLRPTGFTVSDAGRVTTADGGDIQLQLIVTEALGDHWLGQINPVLFGAKSGDQPVRVVIRGDTFAYPLGASGLAAATLDASIALGNLRFGEESLSAQLFEWTGHPGELLSFLPATVTLRDGELRYDELGLDVGNVRVQFRGAVDLVAKSLTEMSLSVPSESLLKVFQDLEGIVEPGDALIIPMRGGIRDPEVDLASFRSEVVRLLSEQPRRAAEREVNRLFERAREAVEGELGEPGGAFVEDVLRSLRGERPAPDAAPAPQEPQRGGGTFAEDILRNLLGGRR